MKAFLICVFSILASQTVFADYTLDPTQSSIHFISVKKTDIAEVHRFKSFNAAVNDAGQITLNIDLSSVATGIDIRDQRIKDELFETARYPGATYRGKLDSTLVSGLEVGDSARVTVEGKLSIHGSEQTINTELVVVRLSHHRLLATTTTPLILKPSALGMTQGVAKLAELAGLPSISDAVPVTFSLQFMATNLPSK